MKSKQQRSLETRARILEAAEERFALEGYELTGVAEICMAASVSKGAFYHHFDSKQEVFLELLNRWLGDMDKQLSALSKVRGDLQERLLSMTRVVRVVLQAAERGLPIYLEFLTRGLRDPVVMQSMSLPFQRYQDFFSEMFEEGISEGTVREMDSQAAARVIIALALGLLIQGVVDPEGADWDRIAGEAIDILFEGLAKR
jgi:AcrR family transcriptional regulator